MSIISGKPAPSGPGFSGSKVAFDGIVSESCDLRVKSVYPEREKGKKKPICCTPSFRGKIRLKRGMRWCESKGNGKYKGL